MFDIFSASGFFVQTPCGPRKSGMPESVEMPAPVSTTTRSASATHFWTSRSKATASGFCGRRRERASADLEADRQRARGREHLRLADIQYGARGVAIAILLHRRHAPDRADAPVGEDFLEEKRVRGDLGVCL